MLVRIGGCSTAMEINDCSVRREVMEHEVRGQGGVFHYNKIIRKPYRTLLKAHNHYKSKIVIKKKVLFDLKTKNVKMPLDLKHIDERMQVMYRKHRDTKGLTKREIQVLYEFIDDLKDDLTISNQKMGKNKKGRSKDVDKQVKMIEALKMNNPLWDIE